MIPVAAAQPPHARHRASPRGRVGVIPTAGAQPRARTDRRRCPRDAGGAVTLCLVLLAPVSMLAAVAALAVPQRLAAESAMHDAAHDIAETAWSRGASRDRVPALTLDPSCDGASASSPSETETRTAMCAVVRSLGTAGFATESVRGFHTNTLYAGVRSPGAPPTAAGAPHVHLCETDAGTVNAEAVYVSMAGDWSQAGWAASQVWPDGLRLGSGALALRNLVAAAPSGGVGRCEAARDAVNSGLIAAAAAGDPVVRHPLRSEP